MPRLGWPGPCCGCGPPAGGMPRFGWSGPCCEGGPPAGGVPRPCCGGPCCECGPAVGGMPRPGPRCGWGVPAGAVPWPGRFGPAAPWRGCPPAGTPDPEWFRMGCPSGPGLPLGGGEPGEPEPVRCVGFPTGGGPVMPGTFCGRAPGAAGALWPGGPVFAAGATGWLGLPVVGGGSGPPTCLCDGPPRPWCVPGLVGPLENPGAPWRGAAPPAGVPGLPCCPAAFCADEPAGPCGDPPRPC